MGNTVEVSLTKQENSLFCSFNLICSFFFLKHECVNRSNSRNKKCSLVVTKSGLIDCGAWRLDSEVKPVPVYQADPVWFSGMDTNQEDLANFALERLK